MICEIINTLFMHMLPYQNIAILYFQRTSKEYQESWTLVFGYYLVWKGAAISPRYLIGIEVAIPEFLLTV